MGTGGFVCRFDRIYFLWACMALSIVLRGRVLHWIAEQAIATNLDRSAGLPFCAKWIHSCREIKGVFWQVRAFCVRQSGLFDKWQCFVSDNQVFWQGPAFCVGQSGLLTSGSVLCQTIRLLFFPQGTAFCVRQSGLVTSDSVLYQTVE